MAFIRAVEAAVGLGKVFLSLSDCVPTIRKGPQILPILCIWQIFTIEPVNFVLSVVLYSSVYTIFSHNLPRFPLPESGPTNYESQKKPGGIICFFCPTLHYQPTQPAIAAKRFLIPYKFVFRLSLYYICVKIDYAHILYIVWASAGAKMLIINRPETTISAEKLRFSFHSWRYPLLSLPRAQSKGLARYAIKVWAPEPEGTEARFPG